MSATTYENVLDSQMLLFFMHFCFEKHSEYIFTKYTEWHFIVKQRMLESLWVCMRFWVDRI